MKKKAILLFMTVKLFIIQSLFFSVLFAVDTDGQKSKNVYQVFVNLNTNEVTLKNAFSEIEKSTKYKFNFHEEDLNLHETINLETGKKSVGEYLKQISAQAGLRFEQVNNVIMVSRIERDETLNTPVENTTMQMLKVTGQVFANEDNSQLPGVSVTVKGTTIGTVTDSDGRFSIEAPENATLVFTFIGYLTEEVIVTGQKSILVSLIPDIKKLDEVVVVGYGTQKKRDLTGAITSVTSEQIDNIPTASITSVLQGKVAGLDIVQNTGEPGGGVTVRVRGTSTLNSGTDPLYIVDGIPIMSNAMTEINQNSTAMNPLSDIDPTDIESIEVLKDAASAAIYGSRAANGVILITTKRGKDGKPVLSLNASTGISMVRNQIGVLNASQYRQFREDAVINAGKYNNGTGDFDERARDSLSVSYGGDVNLQAEMFEKALTQKYDLKLTGGTPSLRYAISAGYLDQEGVLLATKYKRLNTRVNVDYQATKNIKIGNSFAYSRTNSNRTSVGTGWSSIGGIISFAPTFPLFNPDGTYRQQVNDKVNPIVWATQIPASNTQNRLVGNEYVHIDILPGLMIQSDISFDWVDLREDLFEPDWSNKQKQARGHHRANRNFSFENKNLLLYRKSFNNAHNFSAMAGVTNQSWKSERSSIYATDFASNSLTTTNAAMNWTAGNTESEHRMLSYIGRLNYDYKSRYLLTFNFRRDGSSRFGANKRWASFFAPSVGWRLSDEPFMAWSKKVLDDAKIRISYGQTGNESIGDYVSQGAYGVGGNYLGNVLISHKELYNPNIKWESTEQINYGLDMSLLNHRIEVVVDYYEKNTKDLLYRIAIPQTTGLSGLWSNWGSVENKGFELAVISRPVYGNNFRWTNSFTFAVNKNKITDLPVAEEYKGVSVLRPGEPIGNFYGYTMMGVFAYDNSNRFYPKDHEKAGQQIMDDTYTGPYVQLTNGVGGKTFREGDVWFQDKNQDGVIDEKDMGIIGNAQPKFYGGFSNRLEYKGLALDININYVYGNKIYSQFNRKREDMSGNTNYSTEILKRWRKPGDITDVPKAIDNDPMQNARVSTRWIEDGSYIKVRNISLSYELPKPWISKIGMSRCIVFVQGQNLFTITNYDGFDPEVNMSSGLEMGVDNGAYPTSRSYNFGVNVEF